MIAKPTSVEDEDVLLTRAAAFPGFQSLPELTRDKLREISSLHGVDFATALLYDRLKRSPQHSAFIENIDQPASRGTFPQNLTVALVPAAFYKENPGSGADGQLILDSARHLGLRAELIPVSSTGTFAGNAASIHDWLVGHQEEKTILVSLCKGGADVKFALGLPGAPQKFRNVSHWINVCGTLNGSPVAEWLLASKPRFFVAWLYCKSRGQDLDFVRELKPAPPGSLSSPLALPASIRLVNIVGFPLKRHLTNRFMRLCYNRVSSQGPTDGGVLLADVCSLPGVIYPLWGADHYLRPESRARRIISSVLEYLATDNRAELYSRHATLATGQIAQTSLA